MNYQDNLNNINFIENTTIRSKINRTGVITDLELTNGNEFKITVANQHLSKYSYDKLFYEYNITSDETYKDLKEKLFGRIIEFNFKYDEIFNDKRDSEILISRIYSTNNMDQLHYTDWNIMSVIQPIMDKSINGEKPVVDVILEHQETNDTISAYLLNQFNFVGFSYTWINDFIFSMFTYNNKDKISLNYNDILFMEIFTRFILNEVRYYFELNQYYNYHNILRYGASTITEYLKIKLNTEEGLTRREMRIINNTIKELSNLFN